MMFVLMEDGRPIAKSDDLEQLQEAGIHRIALESEPDDDGEDVGFVPRWWPEDEQSWGLYWGDRELYIYEL